MAVGFGALNKAVRERGASSAAVSLDKLSNLVSKQPQIFGQYAGPLSSAAARGSDALAATHYLLGQTSPEYRELTSNLPDDNSTQVTQ